MDVSDDCSSIELAVSIGKHLDSALVQVCCQCVLDCCQPEKYPQVYSFAGRCAASVGTLVNQRTAAATEASM